MTVHACATCTCQAPHVPLHSLDLTGLTDDVCDPADAVQFGVRLPGGSTAACGDQRWVASGQCITDGTYPDGQIVYRTITITYGEWLPA